MQTTTRDSITKSQNNIQNDLHDFLRELIKTGKDQALTDKEITISIQGALGGMVFLSDKLQANQFVIKGNDTDPLFIHTWNHVVDSLSEVIMNLVEQSSNGIELGETNDDGD